MVLPKLIRWLGFSFLSVYDYFHNLKLWNHLWLLHSFMLHNQSSLNIISDHLPDLGSPAPRSRVLPVSSAESCGSVSVFLSPYHGILRWTRFPETSRSRRTIWCTTCDQRLCLLQQIDTWKIALRSLLTRERHGMAQGPAFFPFNSFLLHWAEIHHTLPSASCSYIFTLSFFLLYRRSQPGPLALPLSSPVTLLLFFLQLSKILLISESGTCPPNSFFLTHPRNPDSKLQRVLGWHLLSPLEYELHNGRFPVGSVQCKTLST